MKVWYGYGSEHSMKLVMIGRFKNVGEAAKTKEVVDQLTEQVRADVDANLMMEIGERTDRFTDGMLKLLQNVRLHVLAPAELEQFAYEVSVQLKDNEIVVTTDEVDVSAFLKVLLNEGAKIEVYSAHRYPDTGYGP